MEKGRGIIPIVCFYVHNDEDSPIVCPANGTGQGAAEYETLAHHKARQTAH